GAGPAVAEAAGAHAAGNAVKNLADVKALPTELERGATFQSQDAQKLTPEPKSDTERTRELPGKPLLHVQPARETAPINRPSDHGPLAGRAFSPTRGARTPPPPESTYPSSDEQETPAKPPKKARMSDDPNYW
ncbi:unnamed protein product, partial [Symbiodinium sp. CCMP2592]